eukprot:1673589-Rhodomonas_salina.1
MFSQVEASACLHGIGVVKVMGRSCGYLAAHTALASRDVDICLIPEVAFDMEGRHGLFAHVRRLLRTKGYCVRPRVLALSCGFCRSGCWCCGQC